MPIPINSITLPDGRALVLAHSESSGGGAWRRPVRLTLAETDGTEYRHARATNVLSIAQVWDGLDGRHTGPRSGYGRALLEMRVAMSREAERIAQRDAVKREG